MSKSIRVSEKHGVNPSLLVCPSCGEATGVALCGRLQNDEEAPRKMGDKELCDSCAKTQLLLLEADTNHRGQIIETGNFMIINKSAIDPNTENYEQIMAGSVAFITPADFVTMLQLAEHSGREKNE